MSPCRHHHLESFGLRGPDWEVLKGERPRGQPACTGGLPGTLQPRCQVLCVPCLFLAACLALPANSVNTSGVSRAFQLSPSTLMPVGAFQHLSRPLSTCLCFVDQVVLQRPASQVMSMCPAAAKACASLQARDIEQCCARSAAPCLCFLTAFFQHCLKQQCIRGSDHALCQPPRFKVVV